MRTYVYFLCRQTNATFWREDHSCISWSRVISGWASKQAAENVRRCTSTFSQVFDVNLFVFYYRLFAIKISVGLGKIGMKANLLVDVFVLGKWAALFEISKIIIVQFLAHLVMSLCTHALSVVCRCRCRRHLCHRRPCHWHQRRRLCTALPVTALIIETSYLANICSYTPSICTWNIRSMWHIF